jgi:hypothetical protein
VDLYQGRENLAEYGFRQGTVYRTQTGYALFEYLVQTLNERYPL